MFLDITHDSLNYHQGQDETPIREKNYNLCRFMYIVIMYCVITHAQETVMNTSYTVANFRILEISFLQLPPIQFQAKF